MMLRSAVERDSAKGAFFSFVVLSPSSSQEAQIRDEAAAPHGLIPMRTITAMEKKLTGKCQAQKFYCRNFTGEVLLRKFY